MKKREKLEAQICLQCGSMNWLMVSDSYVGEYRVREDGHIEFNEEFRELEYVCNECGSHAGLLGVKGTTQAFQSLVKLNPMERVLQALSWVVDGTLELTDDVSPEDVLEAVECFKNRLETHHKGEGRIAEGFLSRAREIVGKWKLLSEP